MLVHKLLKVLSPNIFIVAAVASIALGPNGAHAKDAFGLNKQQRADVIKAQKLLNNLGTVKSRFVQATSQGGFSKGQLWMARPGKLRIDYDSPVEVLIVSNGDTLMFKDEELDQFSYTSFDSTPAALLIGGNLNFFGPDLLLTDFDKDENGLRITVQRTDDPMDGSLTLMYSPPPMKFTRWMVIDAQGIATTVSLLEPKYGVVLNPELFKVEQQSFRQRQK